MVTVTGTFLLFAGGCLAFVSNIHIGPARTTLPARPPAADFGTAREIGTRGDDPNPRHLYHGAFPSDEETQERHLGGHPARFSGYTTWVRSVARVPAGGYVKGYPGDYLRIRVTVFNRDNAPQHVCSCDFLVWTRTAGFREADAISAPALSPDTEMRSGARRDGNVYLYVGTVRGPYYVVYAPDDHVSQAASTARGVWRAKL